ncbi:MAG: CD225/dispanin family protein [Muribaculaceae bacterium]|nr:CD225/dispanin family protein [Muribaculaceae bacterium]
MDTQIWVQLDGRQQGPFLLQQLPGLGIRPDTPVWYKGLSDWTIAGNAPLTAGLFYGQTLHQQSDGTFVSGGYSPQAAYAGNRQSLPKCPPTYIALSIIATICCCLPFGIVAIVYSSQVSARYTSGDYEGAEKASQRAELWLILAIVFGLVSAPFAYFSGVLHSLLF